jgi:hypothetical protein
MILLAIKDKNTDLNEARVVATALCALGIIQSFPGGTPSRTNSSYKGCIEISCESTDLLRVKAAFVAVGFSILEDL